MFTWAPSSSEEIITTPVAVLAPANSAGRLQPKPLAFGPDGRYLAVGTFSGGTTTTTVWDVTTRQVRHQLQGHLLPIRSLAFVAGGGYLMTGGGDNRLLLWDLGDGHMVREFQAHSGPVTAILPATTPGTLYTAGEDGVVVELNLVGTALSQHSGGGRAVAMYPDGTKVLTGGDDGVLRIMDAAAPASQSDTPIAPGSAVTDIAISADNTVAVGTTAAGITLIDAGGRISPLPGSPSDATAVAFSPDGRTLAVTGRSAGVVLWDVTTRTRTEIGTDTQGYHSVAFSPDGRTLAAGANDSDIRLWDTASLAELGRLHGHYDSAVSLDFSPNGQRLASGGLDSRVIVWDTATRQRIQVLTGHTLAVSKVKFTDNDTLVSGGFDGTVLL